MRVYALTVILWALASAANAFECPVGVEGQLVPVSWTAERKDAEWTTVHMSVTNGFKKGIRIAIGRAFFVGPFLQRTDGFGGMVVLNGPRVGKTETVTVDATNLKELVGANPGDFELNICVWTVEFTDGTKATF